MEEALTLITKGCEFAKSLETNLPIYLSDDHHPNNIVLEKVEEIIGAFGGARDRILQLLLFAQERLHEDHRPHHQPGPPPPQVIINSSGGLDISAGTSSVLMQHGEECLGTTRDSGSCDLNAAGGSSAPASQQRICRKRNEERDKRMVKMAAPLYGNTDAPPEDGYTWRKYGQKEILGARFPRSYYRCTHQRLYNCQAKKQVQRLDDDPRYFEVLYRGEHTCHMSSTAPSILPPQPLQVVAAAPAGLTGSASTQFPMTAAADATSTSWLSMDVIRPSTCSIGDISSSSTSSNLFDPRYMHMYRDQFNTIIVSNGSNTGGAGSSNTGREQVQGDYQFVSDMADVMFSSGVDSSMELIFAPSSSSETQTQRKWELREKDAP